MQKRVQQISIPGILTLTLSMIFLMTLQKLGYQPRIAGSGSNMIFFMSRGWPRFHSLELWEPTFRPGAADCWEPCFLRAFSRARAYIGVSLDVSNRFDHPTGHRKTGRF